MERLALDLEIADVALDALEDDRRLDVHAEAARLANKYPYAAVTEEEIVAELKDAAVAASVDVRQR